MYKVLLLAHSTPMGHATPTGPHPVPWNQVKSGTEMGVLCELCRSVRMYLSCAVVYYNIFCALY